jgi:hypothetical protein
MRCLVTSTGLLLRLVPAVIFSAVLVQAGQNLVLNPSFELIGPDGADTSLGPASSPPDSPSGAADWLIWNNAGLTPTTSTAYCANADSDPACKIGSFQPTAVDGTHTLHIATDSPGSGIYQQFLPVNTGPMDVVWSIWIYVVSGQVGVGVGNGGATHPVGADQLTNTIGLWQQLISQTDPTNTPANEITVYSVGQGANFFVDAVVVDNPEPANIFGTVAALLLLAGYRLRRG